MNQKCIFEHYREFQARKTLLIDIIKYLLTFLELPLCAYVNTMQRCAVPFPNVRDKLEYFFRQASQA